MEYKFGIIILLFLIYSITDLTIKSRYTRKRLKSKRHKGDNNKNDAIKVALKNNPESEAINSDWTFKL